MRAAPGGSARIALPLVLFGGLYLQLARSLKVTRVPEPILQSASPIPGAARCANAFCALKGSRHDPLSIDDAPKRYDVEARWRKFLKHIRKEAQDAALEASRITENEAVEPHDRLAEPNLLGIKRSAAALEADPIFDRNVSPQRRKLCEADPFA